MVEKSKQSPKKVSSLSKPKVLLYDIETAPILSHVWRLWDQNVGLNQIMSDWHVLSWSAKWLDEPASKIMYDDQSKEKDITNDKRLLQGIWKLLDEADIVITQNGKSFDQKKLNARFVLHGMQPPGTYKHIDLKIIASKHFGFTSNKLEYMTDKLCTKYKKLKHNQFPGHELWVECLAGNKKAWAEMKKYNKHDVLSMEELYHVLSPWDNTINFNLYHDQETHACRCGSLSFHKNGFYYTSAGKFQKHKCSQCGRQHRDKVNLFSKEKRKSLSMSTPINS